jgi:AcrR family transcriptional regulator
MREAGSVRDLRRGQIIRAARRIVAEQGLAALTFGTLERELAFTRGVITYHFEAKDEIVDAVLVDAIAEIDRATEEAVLAETDAADKLVAAFSGMVRGFLARREAARVLLSFGSRVPNEPGLAKKNAALFAHWRAKSTILVKLLVAHGELPSDCNADGLATILVGLVLGVVSQVYFEEGAVDAEAAIAEGARALTGLVVRPATAAPKRAPKRVVRA